MFIVEVKRWDAWRVLHKCSTIGAAVHRYASLIQRGEKARVIYRDGQSVLHIPYMQNK